jgi:phosphatidylinositol alpha-1,6-mannosyltransferase
MMQNSSKTAERINHLVMTDSYLPHSGGSRVYYANLYKNLLLAYPDTVTLLTKKVPGWQEYDRTASTDRFRIIRRFKPLPNWKYEQLPKAIPQLMQAGGTMLSDQYDCLHCGDLFPQAFNGVVLRMIFGVPLIVFCHGDEISQTDRRRHQPKLRDFIYRQADAIVAANEFAFDGLTRIGIAPSRIHKLTPGVDREHFHPDPPKQDLIQKHKLGGKKVILTVARLVPRKGHKVVLEALPKVLPQVKGLAYLIAGDGPEKPRLEQLARDLGVSDSVIFLGDVSHNQIREYYNICDVFLMINRTESQGDIESFGMVFTEANAMGKPVIGGRSGGTAESVLEGQTGFLVDPDSSDEVAGRLCLLLANPDLAREMGATGLRRVAEEFNWESRGLALRKITERLVQARRSRPHGMPRAR